MATQRTRWLRVLKPIPPRAKLVIGCLSFILPILLWCVVSYVPFVWHPQMLITNAGSVDYLQPGMRMENAAFDDAVTEARKANAEPPQGVPANPIYLPAPHEVALALYTAFTTPPVPQDGHWLHESLWHSIQIIFWGFLISSLIGVPLGILCGTYAAMSPSERTLHRILPLPAGAGLRRAGGGHSRHL